MYYDDRPPSVAKPLFLGFVVVCAVLALVWGLPGCGGSGGGGGTAKASTRWPRRGVTHDGNVFYINPKLDRIISYEGLCQQYVDDLGYTNDPVYTSVQNISYPKQTGQPNIVVICHYEGGQ